MGLMRALFAIALGCALSAHVAGCGPSDRSAGAGSTLRFINANGIGGHSGTIYVDDVNVGTVPQGEDRDFNVAPGRRHIEVRWGNDLNPREDLGRHDFAPGATVEISDSA